MEMEQEKVNELIRQIHEISGSSVMLLAPDCGEIMTYPDTPVEFCRRLQNVSIQTKVDGDRDGQAEKPLHRKIAEYIAQNLSEDLSVQAMCRRFAVSKSELYRILRCHAPDGIARYVRQLRFERACDLLRNTSKSLWQIAAEVGYDNPDYFLRAFKKETGISAGKYRKQVREAQCD